MKPLTLRFSLSLCGSALDAAAFGVLMGQERAASVFTDLPYNVPIEGHASGLGAIHHRPFPMASGEMNSAQFTAFLAAAFRNLTLFGADGSLHYICMDWRHLEELLAGARDVYGELVNLCVWSKNSGGMGSLYRSQHELRNARVASKAGHYSDSLLYVISAADDIVRHNNARDPGTVLSSADLRNDYKGRIL